MWSFCVLLDSTPNNVMISIPQELLQSGKTLTIEKSSVHVVSSHHVSQPMHPIPQTHGLCLIDTQRPDQTSDSAVHQLQDDIGDSVEFSRELFDRCEGDAITRMITEHMTLSHTDPEILSFIHLCVLRDTWIGYRASSTGKLFKIWRRVGWSWVSPFYFA